jgi:hypothetical protein
MDREDLREMVGFIEKKLMEFGETTEVPVKHNFSRNVYAREMKMPAGMLIVGKIHRYENLNILSEGEVSVLSQDGVMRVKAPFTFVSGPGSKRAIYAHSDVTWTTIHGTPERDLAKIEDEVIAKSYDQIENYLPEAT